MPKAYEGLKRQSCLMMKDLKVLIEEKYRIVNISMSLRIKLSGVEVIFDCILIV